jgi:hypothetical protein
MRIKLAAREPPLALRRPCKLASKHLTSPQLENADGIFARRNDRPRTQEASPDGSVTGGCSNRQLFIFVSPGHSFEVVEAKPRASSHFHSASGRHAGGHDLH